MGSLGWVLVHLTGALVRRGSLDTQRNTRDACAQTSDDMKTQQEGDHLKAKERGLRKEKKNTSDRHLCLVFLTLRTVRK